MTNGSVDRPGAGHPTSPTATSPTATSPTKAELRRHFRALRRALPDVPERSARIGELLAALPEIDALRRAGTGAALLYTPLLGEPELTGFAALLRGDGLEVRVPEDDPDPAWPAVVIVPGLAFTVAGDRLGQGGGWYDRFLARVRPECVTIGVGFEPQVVAWLPVEPHDVVLHHVVTEAGVLR